jgi:uncharacterized protein YqeY
MGVINNQIDEKIMSAMKTGNQRELIVWRSIKAAFKNYECEKSGNVLTDDVEFKIISKMVAAHKDSIRQYMDACRDDLVEIEMAELEILKTLLPKEPTQEDIEKLVNDFYNNYVDANGESPTIKNMKECITYIHKFFPTANGGVISNFYKTKIQ